jgi:hypothetical protein
MFEDRPSNEQANSVSVHTEHAYRRRYHGLLVRSPLKNVRDRFFRFLDYVGAHAPGPRALIQALSG